MWPEQNTKVASEPRAIFEPIPDEVPRAHVLRLLLQPHHLFGVRVAGDDGVYDLLGQPWMQHQRSPDQR